MNHRLAGVWIPVLGLTALLPRFALGADQKSLEVYVQPTLQDLTATVAVISKNDRELAKIGKGYVDTYRLAKQEIWVKEPGKVAFEGKQGLMTVRRVTNGDRMLLEVALLRVHKVEDISSEPGKGDSVSDLGVVTADWLKRIEARWLRTETRGAQNLQVFEYWYPEDPRAKTTIWMDPTRRTVVERISHHRAVTKPGFKKKFVFSELKQFNGVWLPTRVDLVNSDNKVAASMRYEGIRVNTGVQDKLFTF
jgi:hypothetical protein